MNIAQTVMTAALLKPEIASFGVTTCVTVNAHSTSSATRSMRRTSLTNRTSATARMIRTMAMSRVTAIPAFVGDVLCWRTAVMVQRFN